MFDWFEKILLKVDVAFKEFPTLKYWTLLYVVLVILSVIFYVPLLKFGYSFNYFGKYPLQNFIAGNMDWLIWGRFVVPFVLALCFYWNVSHKHDEKYLKKYKQLPKWIN